MEKVSSAVFPSMSVAVQTYSVFGNSFSGVPNSRRSRSSTPGGSAGGSVYLNVPSPPVAFGSSTGSMASSTVNTIAVPAKSPANSGRVSTYPTAKGEADVTPDTQAMPGSSGVSSSPSDRQPPSS